MVGRITEVEAYGGPDDPASHAYRPTPRSQIMYGPAGRLYVYRIHGHHCANVVTGAVGEGSAVLLRAAAIIEGHALAAQRRGRSVPADHLARGPGNLCRALGITMTDLGTELLGDDTATVPPGPDDVVRLGGRGAPGPISAGPRVGVRAAADRPWRFWVTDDPTVSAYRRHPRAAPTATIRPVPTVE